MSRRTTRHIISIAVCLLVAVESDAQVREQGSVGQGGVKWGQTAGDSRFARALPRVSALEGVTTNFLVPIRLGEDKDGQETTVFSVARQQQSGSSQISIFQMFGGKIGGEGMCFGLYLDGAKAGQLVAAKVPGSKSATVSMQALYLSYKGRGEAEQQDFGFDPAVVLERSGAWGVLREEDELITETFTLSLEGKRLKITARIPKERAISVAVGSCEDTPGKAYGDVTILVSPLDSTNQPRLYGLEYQVSMGM